MAQSNFVKGLRDLADFLEARPELPTYWGEFVIHLWVEEVHKDKISDIVRAFGTATKASDASTLDLIKQFGPIRLILVFPHELVCTKRVVGTKVIPARPATTEFVVEDVEWICPPSLLALSSTIPPTQESTHDTSRSHTTRADDR